MVIAAACVTVLRCAAVLVAGTDAIHSAEDYLIATNIAAGNGYCMVAGIPTAVKAPFVPLILSVFCLTAGTLAPLVIVLVQHCLMSVAAYMLFAMCRSIMSERAALIAGILFLIHPSYLVYPFTIESTPWFIFMSILMLRWFAVQWNQRGSTFGAYLTGGVLSALVYLTQPLVLPLLGILWYNFLRSRIGVPVRRMLVTAAVFVVCISPWVVRNAVEFGAFIPAKSGFWLNFYTGYDMKSHGVAEYAVLPPTRVTEIDSLETLTDDVRMERHYRRAFMDVVQSQPDMYLKKTAVQFIRYWTLPPRYITNGVILSSVAVRIIPQLLLMVIILSATPYLWKHYRWLCIAVMIGTLYFTCVYSLTHTTNIRFKLDSEWMLIPLAGVAAEGIISQYSMSATRPGLEESES